MSVSSSTIPKPASPHSSGIIENTISPPPEVDEEGYSIPPAVTQPWAITEEPDEINSDNENGNENGGNDEFGPLEGDNS